MCGGYVCMKRRYPRRSGDTDNSGPGITGTRETFDVDAGN